MLRNKFFLQPLELFFNPLDLLPSRGTLLLIQLHGRRAGQLPLGAVHNRGYHFQITDQFGSRPGRLFLLPLRFEKQLGIVQNPLADGSRSPPPGGIQSASLARIAAMRGEDGGHALAILQTLPRHRHQKLHRHLCPDLARAHLLLDGLRQKLDQRQPPRYPFHAAIESPRQLRQAVVETLLQLGQQPTHLQRGLVFGKAQRMAAIFAEHRCDTREASALYAAWRRGSAAIRQRILDDPELFFKTQCHRAILPLDRVHGSGCRVGPAYDFPGEVDGISPTGAPAKRPRKSLYPSGGGPLVGSEGPTPQVIHGGGGTPGAYGPASAFIWTSGGGMSTLSPLSGALFYGGTCDQRRRPDRGSYQRRTEATTPEVSSGRAPLRLHWILAAPAQARLRMG